LPPDLCLLVNDELDSWGLWSSVWQGLGWDAASAVMDGRGDGILGLRR